MQGNQQQQSGWTWQPTEQPITGTAKKTKGNGKESIPAETETAGNTLK